MAMDFPATPAVGDLYPDPPVVDVPQYRWDGFVWRAIAPPEGLVYVRRAGDVMTGALGLPGNAVTALQAVPKQQLYDVAGGGLAYSGMQINGSMEVSQENGATLVSSPNLGRKFVLDGWFICSSGPQTGSALQNDTHRPPGFRNCLHLLATGSGNPSPAGFDYLFASQIIEGLRTTRLQWGSASALSITIAFWVYSTRAGVHSGSIQNAGTTRSYPFTFTVNAVAVWEYKVVTIPGDTTGTWLTDNGTGLYINFVGLLGASLSAPAGAWVAGNKIGATGAINPIQTTSDSLLITGVVVLPGIYAPTAAQSPLIMRPYDQELVTCQRYFQVQIICLQGSAAGYWMMPWPLKTSMRASPTVTNVIPGGQNGASVSSEYFGDVSGGSIQILASAASWNILNRTSHFDARL